MMMRVIDFGFAMRLNRPESKLETLSQIELDVHGSERANILVYHLRGLYGVCCCGEDEMSTGSEDRHA